MRISQLWSNCYDYYYYCCLWYPCIIVTLLVVIIVLVFNSIHWPWLSILRLMIYKSESMTSKLVYLTFFCFLNMVLFFSLLFSFFFFSFSFQKFSLVFIRREKNFLFSFFFIFFQMIFFIQIMIWLNPPLKKSIYHFDSYYVYRYLFGCMSVCIYVCMSVGLD